MSKNIENNSILIFILPIFRTFLFLSCGIFIVKIYPFKGMNLLDVSKWWALLVIIVNIITICILFILIKVNRMKFKDLNGRNTIQKPIHYIRISLIMLILGIGGLWGFSYLVYGYIPLICVQPLPISLAILVVILLPISTALSELPLYIGFCAPKIKMKTNSEFLSISYPLFFYALQHSFIPLIFDFQHMLSRFLMFIPLLVMIGIYYYKKKEILSLMIGHGVLDTITGIQLLIISIHPSIYETMNSNIR